MSDLENMTIIELKKLAKENNQEIFKISGYTGEGIDELMKRVSELLKTLPKEDLIEVDTSSKEKIYTLNDEKEFVVSKEKGKFVVKGNVVEKIIRRVNIADYESLFYLHRKLNEIGVTDELKRLGVKEGDIVKIGSYELEWED